MEARDLSNADKRLAAGAVTPAYVPARHHRDTVSRDRLNASAAQARHPGYSRYRHGHKCDTAAAHSTAPGADVSARLGAGLVVAALSLTARPLSLIHISEPTRPY